MLDTIVHIAIGLGSLFLIGVVLFLMGCLIYEVISLFVHNMGQITKNERALEWVKADVETLKNKCAKIEAKLEDKEK